jgi:hypothetical protein
MAARRRRAAGDFPTGHERSGHEICKNRAGSPWPPEHWSRFNPDFSQFSISQFSIKVFVHFRDSSTRNSASNNTEFPAGDIASPLEKYEVGKALVAGRAASWLTKRHIDPQESRATDRVMPCCRGVPSGSAAAFFLPGRDHFCSPESSHHRDNPDAGG